LSFDACLLETDKQTKTEQNPMKKTLKGAFLTGLAVVVPIGLTVYVLAILIEVMDRFLDWLPAPWHPDAWIGIHVPGLGALAVVAFVILCGAATRSYVGRLAVRYGETLVEKIPFVRGIYQATKRISDSFFTDRGRSFKRVVLIEYPRPGVFALAFVTGTAGPELNRKAGRSCLGVFVPTTPNPTSGFYLLVPEEEVLDTNLTVEEAFTRIVSCGFATPTEKAANEQMG